ncbi:MAG: DUF5682 family protein [Saprospiraceae bacterium]
MIYYPKDIKQAIYLPFAEFSPEWQAMLYAKEKNIPIRFMDLPMTLSFALDDQDKNVIQHKMDMEEKMTKGATIPTRPDGLLSTPRGLYG